MSEAEARLIRDEWLLSARPEQYPLGLAAHTWLVTGGRGAGKTRLGAVWVNGLARGLPPFAAKPEGPIALVGETLADVREVMIEGPSGIRTISRHDRPRFEPTRRRLVWHNGMVAQAFSAEDPEALRGPQFAAAWCDELAKWRLADATFDMLQFGLRLGARPRQLVTTTPRPIPLFRRLLDDPAVRVTRMSTGFDAHLGREVTTLCHCWRLTRRDGLALGFTDHDEALSFGGTAFQPETGLSASEAKSSLGLGTDTVDVEGVLSSAAIAEGDISTGLYDGAKVEAFLVNWREPEQRELLRRATVGKIVAADGRFTAELESLAATLDQPSGRFVTRACDAEVGDGRCKVALNAAAYRGTGTVTAVSGSGAPRVSGLGAFASGWFSGGVLTWSGSGRAARVRGHRKDAGGVELVLEAGGAAVAVGDGFAVTAGCDKSFATCGAKFANRVNFRGFPHLPGNDAAYAYVADGVAFDGKALVP